MELKRASLVLADISGYTRFMREHKTTLLHAEHIITELLEAVIDSAQSPLTISKLEGDAVFMTAHSGDDPAATARIVQQQALTFFDAFNGKMASMNAGAFCTCESCSNISRLKLKVVLHHAEVAFKTVRQFEEVAGEDVILLHRLMKNSVPGKEYLLQTAQFYDLAGGIPGMTPELRTERIEDLGNRRIAVFYPNPADAPVIVPTRAQRFFAGVDLMTYTLLRRVGLRREPAFTNLPQSQRLETA
jgi:hypothetical protein